MAVIKRKTKKAITKQLNKLVKRHGAEVAMGLATGLVSTVIGATTADSDAKPKKPKAEGRTKKDASAEKKPEKKPGKKPEKKPGKKPKQNDGKENGGKAKRNKKDSAG